MENGKDLRLAVLIDADNIPYRLISGILEEIAKYGSPTFKRIYADWTKPHVTGWKTVLLDNAITPIQQYSYTTGKNSSDSALIIDAMDILYSGKVDGFCIISSDSDFTRLATRLREAGMTVIGLGEKKTPNPFIVACDKFIYLEILTIRTEESKAKVESVKGREVKAPPAETLQKIGRDTINLIATSITDLADDSGWAFLGEVGSLILKKQPDFDPRKFWFGKLALLIKSISKFEGDERETEKQRSKVVYVRVKS